MTESLATAAVFSDNMVLQRRKDIAVFGIGQPGLSVTVSLGKSIAQGIVDKEGLWCVSLPPMEAGGPFDMTVSDGTKSVSYRNILIGDVWFAGGQSNMELELQNCRDGKREVSNCLNEKIRFYNVSKIAFEGDELTEAELSSSWQVCGPDTAATMSAVAYFYARRLESELSVPIGIIDCYWGGTSVSCWMSENQLARSKAGQQYLDDYRALIGDKTDRQYEQEMEAYQAEYNAWNQRVEAMRKANPAVTWDVLNEKCGICPWPQPAGRKSPFRPSGIYHSMLRRIAPYTIKGFLYYQGEEDVRRCEDYGEMMYYLIDQWHTDWCDDDLPFIFVQLPMYTSKVDYDNGVDGKEWSILREQQWKVARTVRNTGLAVIIDCGEFDNIHPLDKQTVGERLALQAFKSVYGKDVAAFGPIFVTARNEGNKIRVFFDHAEGLFLKDSDLSGFEIAGPDGFYDAAAASIDYQTVVLTSPKVGYPLHVRYAWTNWGATPLYNAVGLPAMPFRSSREF